MGFGEPEIKVVKDTWEVVKTLPAETVGGLLFKHIFEQADVSALFSFGRVEGFDPNPEAVAANPAVMKHGGKVVGTVSVAVSMLDDLPNLVPVLKDLGAKHATYGVVAAHFPVVGAAFLKTLSVGLGDAYTDEVAAAFTGLWGVVEATMLAGAAEKEAADNSPGLVKEGSGNYVAAPTADGEADVKESMTKAVDWYSNPKAEARG